jgi:aldehyde:ferredoxin oxidoreductase
VKAEYGKEAQVSCIGPSGEKMALISCIVTKRGAADGRSGLGAVMGSKKLKAVVVRGNMEVPMANKERAAQLRRENIAELHVENMRKYGTSSMADRSAHSGDSPVKNWGGIGIKDLPDVKGLSGDAAIANVDRADPCWHCPVACQALLKAGTGEYKYPAGVRRVEYETQAAFGVNCLNNNIEALNMCNHLCNDYGLDTISGGTVIAFAMECYENGVITKKDTGGIDLTWGNHRAMVDMLEKVVKREGFGDILADGVQVAAKRIGRKAEKYAVHAGGQEVGMHDPKLIGFFGQFAGARYQMDATPGRHTAGFGPDSFRGHIMNAAGICLFGSMGPPGPKNYLVEFMSAVTGWERSMEELLKCGERIANMRHVFNLREGINPLKVKVHPRIIGKPPQKEGPLAGVTVDIEPQIYWCLGALDWDRITTKPSRQKLLSLGLKDVAEELWPPQAMPRFGPP